MNRPQRRRPVVAVCLVAACLVAACTADDGSPPPTTAGNLPGSGAVASVPRVALVDHPARVQRAPAAALAAPGPFTPTSTVAPTGVAWTDAPAPTNQWWSSLTTSRPARLWLVPLAVELRPIGIEIAAPTPVVGRDEIVNDWQPFARLRTAGAPQVLGYGDFSVTIRTGVPSGAVVTSTLAQGLPMLTLRSTPGTLELELLSPTDTVRTVGGERLEAVATTTTTGLRVTSGGRHWDLRADRPVRWSRDGQLLRVSFDEPASLTLARPPADAGARWDDLLDEHARHPVTSTSATATVADGHVRTTLRFERDVAAPTLMALLPHQVATLADAPTVLGTYPSERGTLSLVASETVDLRVPLPGVLFGPVPVDATRADVDALVSLDIANVEVRSGSYFGARDLGRLAAVVDGLDALGPPPALVSTRDQLVDLIADELQDRMAYSGPTDDRWLAVEPLRGGVLAIPPEFGSENYNDRHFHFGYLLDAAAVAARHRSLDAATTSALDLLASSLLSSGASAVGATVTDAGVVDLGSGGVFSPWLGHSLADGLAGSNRGNNQESSSEAVHAWYGAARWWITTDRPVAADAALARYALETLAARTYWLDELDAIPAGYAHPTVGIVWGDRLEHRTFFSPEEQAIVGIQLLPFSYGSLYRADPERARARSTPLLSATELWPDVLLLDVGLDDPAKARRTLDELATRRRSRTATDVQGGTSFVFSAAWLAMIDQRGLPVGSTTASPPIAREFVTERGRRAIVAVNASSRPVDVTVRVEGRSAPIVVQVPARSTRVVDTTR